MRNTSPDLSAPDRTPPTPLWYPEVPTQRSEVWRDLERPRQSIRTSTAAHPTITGNAGYTSPDGSQWSWDGDQWVPVFVEPVRVRRWRSRRTILGGAACLAVLVGGGILAASHGQGGSVTRAEQLGIRNTLFAAGIAQTAHQAETLSYTTSIDDLIRAGFEPAPFVTVTVVTASDDGFCLAAGPYGAQPVLWLTEDGESTLPCG